MIVVISMNMEKDILFIKSLHNYNLKIQREFWG
jgi:hypothetical protein